jgi:hypothetical protein
MDAREPKRDVERTDNVLPISTVFTTLHLCTEAKYNNPKTETPEPTLAKPRIESDEPSSRYPRVLTREPNLTVERTLSDEATVNAP